MSGLITQIHKPVVRDVGGFNVRRVLPGFPDKMIGPFIFFDHMGPAALPTGQGMDVRPHPHIGLATVTYLFEGAIMHRDSLGSEQLIRPGDVNWMTAGRGIVHSERSPPEERERGVRMHGVQVWVALPKTHERTDPDFSHHPAASLPRLQRDSVKLVVVVGSAFGLRSPVRTFSEMFYADAELEAGASLTLDTEHAERGVYVASGEVQIDGQDLSESQLARLQTGSAVELRARTRARLMLLGGAPMDGDRLIWWNFVASTPELLERAKQDWHEDRFAKVPGETERIPLPEKT